MTEFRFSAGANDHAMQLGMSGDGWVNATFGVVMRADERRRLLLPLHGETSSWADETVEVGTYGYEYPGLEDVVFEVYPVTHFVRKRLFGELRVADIECVSLDGSALDRYERFLQDGQGSSAELSDFERGLLSFVNKLSEAAVLFAPEGGGVKDYMETPRSGLIPLLRTHAKDIELSTGFLATLER